MVSIHLRRTIEDDITLKSIPVSGSDLAKALIREDGYRIPLIMLAACQSATGSFEKGFDSITSDLLMHGFPNIIAMSMSIMDDHVTQFSKYLYNQLNKGNSILSSFYEAIRYLKNFEVNYINKKFSSTNLNEIIPFQHTIPCIYSRTKDFRLFDPDLISA